MEQEIQKLQARLDKAKEVFREMNAKDKEKDARIAELEAQLAEAVAIANNNSTVGNDAITELKAQLRTMEDRYNHSDTYCEKFKEDNEKLTKENEMLRNQVEGAKNDINELVVANANLKEKNESYEIANEDLRFENMKNKGERDRIEIDYNALSESFKTVTEENSKLKEIAIEYRERFKMYEETNAEYKQSIDKLVESKHSLETTISELNDEINELTSALEYANSEKDRLLSELEQANNYITKKETHFNSLQTLLNDRQAQIIELEKTIESLSSTNKMLEDELGQARHDNSLIKENVTKHVAAIKSSMKGLNDGLGVEFDIFGN